MCASRVDPTCVDRAEREAHFKLNRIRCRRRAITNHVATDGRGVAARPVYIVDGSRTPFIRARGRPGPFTPVDLAVACGRPLLLRQPFAPDAFDQVILGCVNVLADEMNPARVAALRLGMGDAMPAFTVQINCGSGMQSIDTAYQYIREGHADLILAGGAEALSQSPLLFRKSAVEWYARLAGARDIWSRLVALAGFRPSFLKPVIGLERGLTDPVVELNMGQTAEILAHLFHISRASRRRIRGREPAAARARADGKMVRRRARARLRPQRHGLRLRRRRAAGHHGRDAGQAQAGVRAAVGQGDGGQQLADHRRRLVGHPRVRNRR